MWCRVFRLGGGHGNSLQYSCLENPHKQRSLMGYSPWGRKELDTTGWLNKHSTESLEWPSGELSFWISLPGKGVTSLMNALSSCGQSELYNSSSFPLCCWLLGRQIEMCGLKELGLFWTENLSQTGLHQTGFVGSCKEKAVGGPVGPGGLSHSL